MTSVTEEELVASATAERVTNDFAEQAIIGEYWFTTDQPFSFENIPTFHRTQLSLLTICVLVLENGFTVIGESACAHPENFNQDIGRRLAREAAKRKVWPLLGYALRTKLALKADAAEASKAGMSTHVGTKVVHARPMTLGNYNELRSWPMPRDEHPLTEGYLVEYADGDGPNVEGFAGYVTWSPKAVFERSYGKPE